MEYGFSSQVHILSVPGFCVRVCNKSPGSATQMKVLDPAASSMWCNLTKPHNTTMAFIPTMMSGREPSNTNKKAFTVHPNADKL